MLQAALLASQGTQGHCHVAPAPHPVPVHPPPLLLLSGGGAAERARVGPSEMLGRSPAQTEAWRWFLGPQSPIHKVGAQSEDSEAPPPPALTVHGSQERSWPGRRAHHLPSSLPSVLRALPGRGAWGSVESRCTELALSPARTSAENPPLHYPLPLPTRKQAEAGTTTRHSANSDPQEDV